MADSVFSVAPKCLGFESFFNDVPAFRIQGIQTKFGPSFGPRDVGQIVTAWHATASWLANPLNLRHMRNFLQEI
jgi:hypothetical protein